MSLSQPLPERLRPSELALFVGQSHLAERLTTLLGRPAPSKPAPVRPSGLRQIHAGPPARTRPGRQRPAPERSRGRFAAAPAPAYRCRYPCARRAAPLLKGAAGLLPPVAGVRRSHHDRHDHGKPLFQRDPPAAFAAARPEAAPARAARTARTRQARSGGPFRHPERRDP